MTIQKLHGVYAALLTPRHGDNSIKVSALSKMVRFLMLNGISSFAVNGATGEYCLTTPEQMRTILATVQDASQCKANIFCGVGAPSLGCATDLAEIAQSANVAGLLLPMPHFFPYEQQDLDLFCREVASSTDLPILLYNLPQFTSGLHKETARRLITEVPNIIGVKDSGSSLEILRDLTEHGVQACRIVGNDGILAAALAEGLCDGVVSGVACVLPEVILALYAQREQTDSVKFRRTSYLLNEFLAQLNQFPTPWGLKWIAEARGVIEATFSQPVTRDRLTKSQEMADWFKEWSGPVISQLKIASENFSL